MRNIYSFLAAAIVLSAVSCNKELIDADNLGYVVSYTATMDGTDVESKAVLGTSANSKPQSMWEANDEITIHNGNQGFTFKTAESGKPSAKFGYTGTDFTPVDEVIAIYPSGSHEVDINTRTITTNISTWQEGKAGTYNPSSALAVAYSTDGTLNFKNACALLKFTVGTSNMKSVTISGNNGEKISGEVSVVLNTDGAIKSVASTTNSQGYVQIWKHDGSLMKQGEIYYVAIIPQTFKYGLKAEAQNTNDSQPKYRVKETPSNYTVSRNTIVDLGTISHNTSAKIGTGWMLPGGYNSWATSTDNGSTRYFYDIGDVYVVKNVKIMETVSGQNAGFKVTNGTDWKGTSSTDNFALNKWHDLENGKNNIKVSANDYYDVYISDALDQIYITKTGNSAPTVNRCRLKVRVNKEIDWYNKYIYAWTGNSSPILGNWPGKQLKYIGEDGDYYVYYHDFETSYDNKAINFIINNNGGGQTKDLSITLNGFETVYDVHKGLLK